MILKVVMARKVYEALENIRKDIGGYERCGLLFGELHGNEIIIAEIVEIENVRKSSSEFELDSLQTLKAFEKAEKEGMEVVGVWHTHPLWIPYPSKKDREGMRVYPGVWVIISGSGIKAYFGNEKGFLEASIEVMESPQ